MADYTTNFCSKWTDHTDKTFNVDNPVFWPPMPVISGIASGLCERRAVLSSSFSGTVWNDTNSNTIVTRCANGLALGKTGDDLFAAANDASFHAVGVAGSTNYMTATDAAITSLISGTTYFTTADGSQYNTVNGTVFSGLAVAASAAASAAASRYSNPVSAIATPNSNGGTMNTTFNAAYPVEWAKQRKWMLDELRYTGGAVNYTGDDLYYTQLYYNGGPLSATSLEGCRSACYTAMANDQALHYWRHYYCYTVERHVDSSWQLGETLVFAATYTPNSNKWTTATYKYRWPQDYNNSANAVYINGTTACIDGGTYTVQAVFAQGSLYKHNNLVGSTDFSYSKVLTVVSTGQETADGAASESSPSNEVSDAIYTSDGIECYEVKPGAKLVVPSNKQPYSILVSSGGCVQFVNGGRAETCVVLTGGTVLGVPNVAKGLCIDGFYPLLDNDYTGDNLGSDFVATFRCPLIGDTYTEVTTAATYTAATSAVYVGTNGKLTIDSDVTAMLRTVVVGGGGSALISGTSAQQAKCNSATFIVLSGGTIDLSRYYHISHSDLVVYPGGTAIINDSVPSGDYDTASFSDSSTKFHIGQGATIKITRPSSNVYLAARACFYVNSNCMTTGTGRPSVYDGDSIATSSLFENTAICGFNGNGLQLNGTATSVVEGLNTATMTITNSQIEQSGVQGIAHIDTTKLALTPANIAPTTGCYTGAESTSVLYRCSLVSFDITSGNGTGISNHYTQFRVRQFAT